MTADNTLNQNISHYIDLLESDRPTSLRAAQSLAQIGEPAIPALLQAIREKERWFAAAEALTSIGEPAIQPLIDLMRDSPYGNFAFHALTNMGDLAIPAFIAVLSDPDPEVRMWAAAALEEHPPIQAYDALVEALHDPDANVRESVIKALQTYNRRDTLPKLQQLWKHEKHATVQLALDVAIRHLSSL